MIKSLLGEDEIADKEKKESPEVKGEENNSAQNTEIKTDNVKTQEDIKTENTVVDTPSDEIETIDEIKTAIETGDISPKETEQTPNNNPQTVQPFEVNKPIGQPIIERKTNVDESSNEQKDEIINQENENSTRTSELEKKLRELEEELKKEKELESQGLRKETTEKARAKQQVETTKKAEAETFVPSKEEKTTLFEDNWDKEDEAKKAEDDNAIQIKPKDFVPESKAEGIRRMGMAWSAAIAFFGSVVFMLVLGWGADLLLGSEPWGIVVGIIIGAVIGFVQLIRTTSQIFNTNKPNDFDKVSLKSSIETVDNKKVEGNIEKTEVENDNKIEEKIEEIELVKPEKEVVNNIKNVVDEGETVVKTDS